MKRTIVVVIVLSFVELASTSSMAQTPEFRAYVARLAPSCVKEIPKSPSKLLERILDEAVGVTGAIEAGYVSKAEALKSYRFARTTVDDPPKEATSEEIRFAACFFDALIATLAATPVEGPVPGGDPHAAELANLCSAERDAAITFARQQSRVDFRNMGTRETLDRAIEDAATRDRASTLDHKAVWETSPGNKLSEFHVCVANARLRQLGRAPEPERTNAFTGGTLANSPERLVECRALATARNLQGPPRQEYLDDCVGVYSLMPPPAEETDAQATARGKALITRLRPSCMDEREQGVKNKVNLQGKTRDEAVRDVDAFADGYAARLARGGWADVANQQASDPFQYVACLFKQARLNR